MNCKDLEELLSAYADGELSRTQSEFVEEHLSGCADCRATLADFTMVRRRLMSLRTMPATPDITEAAMSKIKHIGKPTQTRMQTAFFGLGGELFNHIYTRLKSLAPRRLTWQMLTAVGLIVVAFLIIQGIGITENPPAFVNNPFPVATPAPPPTPTILPAPTPAPETPPVTQAVPTQPLPTPPAETPLPIPEPPAEAPPAPVPGPSNILPSKPAPTPLPPLDQIPGVFPLTGSSSPPQAPPVPPPAPAPAPSPVQERPWFRLQTMATMSKQVYTLGDVIDIQLTFTNKDTEYGVISPFPPEIEIATAAPQGGYSQKTVLSFNTSNETVTLAPGEIKTYAFSWDQKKSDGGQAAPGWYMIVVKPTGWAASYPGAAVGLDWSTISFLIQYPQGAMEKTIAVNESRTVGDITITLKQVEMTREFTKFVFVAPHDTPGPHPTNPVVGYAEYQLEDGIVKDAGSGRDFGRSVIAVNPVPSDARVITFVITSIGWGQGTWEFRVPLDTLSPSVSKYSTVDIFLEAGTGTISIDDQFPVNIKVDAGSQELVAIDAFINFDPVLFALKS